MRRLRWCSSILIVGVLLAGCPPEGQPPSELTAGEFIERYLRGAGERLERCAPAYDVFSVRGSPDGSGAPFDAIVTDGRALFDPAAAAECLAALERPCAPGDNLAFDGKWVATVCGGVFTGRVADGGSCTVAYECASGRCAGPRLGCGPSNCEPLASAGEACALTEDCEGDLVCDRERCAPGRVAGERCGSDEANRWMACAPGLACFALDLRDPPRCVDVRFERPLGATCGTDGQLCAPGLVCATRGDEHRCEAPYASGAPCTHAFPSDCPRGEYCAGSADAARCTPAPSEGEHCEHGSRLLRDPPCAPGLECGQDEVCRRPTRALGERCADDSECLSLECARGECIPALTLRPSYCT